MVFGQGVNGAHKVAPQALAGCWSLEEERPEFGELQGFIRQELSDFGEALQDHFSECFNRQELLMNQHALRLENLVFSEPAVAAAASRRSSKANNVVHEQSLQQNASRLSSKEKLNLRAMSCVALEGRSPSYAPEGGIATEAGFTDARIGRPPSALSLPTMSHNDTISPATICRLETNSERGVEGETSKPSRGCRSEYSLDSDPETFIPKEAPRAFHPLDPTWLGDDSFKWRRMVSLRLAEIRKDLGEPGWKVFGGWMDWWLELTEPEHEGRLAELVTGKAFGVACFSVLLINSLVTVVTTDWEAKHQKHDVSIVSVALNAGFVIFYITELFLKLLVHGRYFFCNGDMAWNLFDTGLVIAAIVDTVWDMITARAHLVSMDTMDTLADSVTLRTARVLRLAKILRMVRLIHFFAELRYILNSLVGSFLSLFWSIIMLVFMFFIFALVFVQRATTVLISGDLSPEDRATLQRHMGSTEMGMLMLFKATTGGEDWNEFYSAVKLTGHMGGMLFLFFIAFSSFALMNILTGIFVENAMKLAQPDRETVVVQQRKNDLIEANELRMLLQSIDSDGTGMITQDMFMEELRNEQFRTQLALMGLDIKSAELFFHIISSGQETQDVSIETFVTGAMRLKGQASSLDLHTLHLGTKILHDNQVRLYASIDRVLQAVGAWSGEVLALRSGEVLAQRSGEVCPAKSVH